VPLLIGGLGEADHDSVVPGEDGGIDSDRVEGVAEEATQYRCSPTLFLQEGFVTFGIAFTASPCQGRPCEIAITITQNKVPSLSSPPMASPNSLSFPFLPTPRPISHRNVSHRPFGLMAGLLYLGVKSMVIG
jgi:hypothetical protein